MAMVKRSYSVPAYRRPQSISRFAPIAIRAGRALGTAIKRYRSSKSQPPSKKQKTSGGVSGVTTYQHDVKQVYRKRRLPRKTYTKLRRSRRSYISNTLRALQSRKYHYNGTMNFQTSAAAQYWFGWFNYGAFGTGGVDGSGDMQDLLVRLNTETQTAGTKAQQDMGTGGIQGRKYFFDNMSCRVVLTNVGTTNVFWEIYECVARKDIPLSGNGASGVSFTMEQYYASLSNAVFQATLPSADGGAAQSATQTSAASLPSISTPGITPFQMRRFCQDYKIMKCTRMQCSPGNTVSFNANNPKNYTVVYDDWKDLSAKRGITKLYLVRQWGAITSGTAGNAATNVSCELEKDYNVKVLDTNPPELNYITYTNNVES